MHGMYVKIIHGSVHILHNFLFLSTLPF